MDQICFDEITACGENCEGCEKKKTGACKGCIAADGYVPEWAGSGRCPVHACCRDHHVQFCGLCSAFPCADLTKKVHWNPEIVSRQRELADRCRERGYPGRVQAELLLAEAEQRNPGPWGNHSRTAAHCAEKIALYAGMDPEKAYVLGLLHDIGRRFGKRHLGHVSDGYSYMMSLGWKDAARICLTHSFNAGKIEAYIGNFDTSEEETELIRSALEEAVPDDYDRLIQLCDAISGAEGVMDIVDRMSDVKRRYGSYDPEKWDTNLSMKAYFESRMGKNLYEAVEKDRFSPSPAGQPSC